MSSKRKLRALARAAGALFLFTVWASCFAEPEPRMVVRTHSIDKDVWINRQPINWPGTDHRVHVIFDVDESFTICGRGLTEVGKAGLRRRDGMLFGKACGKLLVLVRPQSIFENDRVEQLLTTHESFHLAVQYNSLLPRVDVAGFPGYPARPSLASIERYAEGMIDVLLTSNGNPCPELISGWHELLSAERAYLSYRSYWEWPAVFYTREVLFPDRTFKEFRAEREMLTPDADERAVYFAGAISIEKIEENMPRAEWQRRYMNGASMLNLLADSLGCSAFNAPSLQASTYTWENVFTDGRD